MNGKVKKNIMQTNFLKVITLLTVILVISSCGKTKLSQLTYSVDEDEEYVYVKKNDKNFKGTAWTEDGESLMILSDANGLIQEVIVFHPNGKKCITLKLNSDGIMQDYGHYDELGNVMNERHWGDVYGEYVDRIVNTMLPKDLRDVAW